MSRPKDPETGDRPFETPEDWDFQSSVALQLFDEREATGRGHRRVSLEKVAKKVHISKEMLSRWERLGRREGPVDNQRGIGLLQLSAWARGLGLRPVVGFDRREETYLQEVLAAARAVLEPERRREVLRLLQACADADLDDIENAANTLHKLAAAARAESRRRGA